jgi:hypothetical protein
MTENFPTAADGTKNCYKNETCPPEQWNNISCTCVDPSNANNPNTTEGQNRTARSAAMNAAIQKCSQDTDVAKSDCDQDHDPGIQGAQTTLSNFAVETGSQLGIAGACSGMAKYVAGANAAVIYFTQNCSSSRSNCVTSCQKARTAVNGASAATQSEVTDLLNSCKDLDTKIQQGTQAIQNLVGTIQSSQSCAKQTDAALVDYCASNPGAIGCSALSTDCSNPSVAASNQICICKNNPGSSACTGALAKTSGGGFDSANMNALPGGAGGAAGVGSPGSDNLMGDANWAGDPNLKADKRASEEAGGKKGGRPLLDGGGGGGAGGAGDKGKGGGTPAQGIAVNAGFRGGGGGGGWGGEGNGGGEGGYAAQLPSEAGAKGPNLRDFLPGGGLDPKTVSRGLAGISGPDGITGPHSDIWKKVQHRYQIQVEKSTLMP